MFLFLFDKVLTNQIYTQVLVAKFSHGTYSLAEVTLDMFLLRLWQKYWKFKAITLQSIGLNA